MLGDVNGDEKTELHLSARNGVGVFQEKDGNVYCIYWNILDKGEDENSIILSSDITKHGKLILDYQLKESHSYGRKTEIFQLSQENCFELENCLTDYYEYSVGDNEYGMNDVEISEEEYYLQIAEAFEGYYESDGYSSSIPLLLAMNREFPDADHFEGFWHQYDCLDAPKDEIFLKDDSVVIRNQNNTGFSLYISVYEHREEEILETDAVLVSPNTAVFKGPTGEGGNVYGIIRLSDGVIEVSDLLLENFEIENNKYINLGYLSLRVNGFYFSMEQEIESYMNQYFQAIERGDSRSAEMLMNDQEGIEADRVGIMSRQGLEKIENVVQLTYPLDEYGKLWIVLISYQMKVEGIDTALPCFNTYFLSRDTGKHWSASRDQNSLAENVTELLNNLPADWVQKREEIKRQVDLQFREALEQDEALSVWLSTVNEELSLVRAERNTEQENEELKAEAWAMDSWAYLEYLDEMKEPYPLLENRADYGDYIELYSQDYYRVEPGDSLWGISMKKWGNGENYISIINQNKELLDDPNLIFPGMKLSVAHSSYIRRETLGGISMGEYRFDTPVQWASGTGNHGTMVVYSRDAMFSKVFCRINQRQSNTDGFLANWTETSEIISRYVEDYYSEDIRNLTFEQYDMDDGQLYVYSYCMNTVIQREDSSSVEHPFILTVATKVTDSLQAEFVGVSYAKDDYNISGTTRYMGASFREESAYQEDGEYFEHNLVITPEYEWELDGLFNPFPWMANYHND